ncbi:MAG: SpoIIE family protein phosphatase [Planctomycetota bacterium]
MTCFQYSSEESSRPQEFHTTSGFQIASFFQPYGGDLRGGDRFGIITPEPNKLWFYIGDATGHGSQGALFWKHYEESFHQFWNALLYEDASDESFSRFVSKLNDRLLARNHPLAQLCLTFGIFLGNGDVFFSTCGYGTHLLASRRHSDRVPPETSFGLKLGWLSSSQRATFPNALIFRRYRDVDRIVLMTDSFLGEDHRDPEATRTLISQMNEKSQIQSIEWTQVIPYFLKHFPDENDDTTILVIERTACKSDS